MKKFYITTPIYYVNGNPHIGHSYTSVACDVLSRFKRLQDYEVVFSTGTDEHGQKINDAAIEIGLEPKAFVDTIVPKFKMLWEKLNISYDRFIRTTDKEHTEVVKKILDILYKKGDFYEGEYIGWYCTPCESFWIESQLKDGMCPDCSRKVEYIKEKNIFFKLSKYQAWLIDYINTHDDFIRPSIRKNEITAFLKNPLNDLCISRPKSRMPWGINMPFSEEHVTYVWFDALINYISVCGYGSDTEKFNKFWPADIHMIGKDILRPHTVYWPIMLHAAGLEMPKTVFAHGWWKIGDSKMSKSKGNVINPLDLVDKYGVDAYRYFLLREVPFGVDGSFSEDALISRINSDLANDLGNLLHRTLSMIEKYFDSYVPERRPLSDKENTPGAIIYEANALKLKVESALEKINFSAALTSIWELVNIANKYIEQKAPWKLSKEGKVDELRDLMYDLYEVLRIVSLHIAPFLPNSTNEINKQLGLADEKISLGDNALWRSNDTGKKINKGNPIFPRIETK